MQSERCLDTGDVMPSALSHLIGQRGVVAQAQVALEAAWADGKKFDSSLLVGPPGCGKSVVAQVIAQEMGTDFHEVLGQSIASPADLNALLLEAKDRSVVHIDECHELDKAYQTALYLAIDQKRLVLGSKSGRVPQTIPIADFSLLISTTDEYALLQPLRDRMRLLLRFQFYTSEELAEITRQRSKALGWEVEAKVLPLIAQRSRGTPRLALRLLQACRRVCRAEGEIRITLSHLERACQLEQIDALGLGPVEKQCLQILAEGASRLNVIASVLGLPPRTVSQVTEPFLIRAGLIIKDDQGRRQLTAKGRQHMAAQPDV